MRQIHLWTFLRVVLIVSQQSGVHRLIKVKKLVSIGRVEKKWIEFEQAIIAKLWIMWIVQWNSKDD